jgi:Tfp pilus assembly protein PilO
MTNFLGSLLMPIGLILIAFIGYKFFIKKETPKLTDFDKDFEELKSKINVCNDYYTLHDYKRELKALRLKYVDMQDFVVDDCTKLLKRLDQKIINNTQVARKVSRR